MTQLTILRYPNRRLFKIAQTVTKFDMWLHELIKDMADTMYNAPGIGLAATQVDIHKKIIVIDISETRDHLMVFVNPEILWVSEEKTWYDEGCLSVPGIYDGVERPSEIKIRAHSPEGVIFEVHAKGLLATCIQHEMDHLKGIVFVDHLSPLKRNRIKTKLIKELRDTQQN